MLDAENNTCIKQPLYKGCKDDHSALSAVIRLMGIKTNYNLAEEYVDAIADFVRGVLPEDNRAPIYYEVQKLVADLSLPQGILGEIISLLKSR